MILAKSRDYTFTAAARPNDQRQHCARSFRIASIAPDGLFNADFVIGQEGDSAKEGSRMRFRLCERQRRSDVTSTSITYLRPDVQVHPLVLSFDLCAPLYRFSCVYPLANERASPSLVLSGFSNEADFRLSFSHAMRFPRVISVTSDGRRRSRSLLNGRSFPKSLAHGREIVAKVARRRS